MEKTSEMNLGRISILGLSLALAIYVGLGFHWGVDAPLSGKITWGMVLGIAAGLAIFGTSYFFCMVNVKSVNFLNEVEGELRKVVWPESKPFAATTELWQYTLAVIGLMVVLVVYISIVDSGISYLLKRLILTK
mgnify:CR=1 FL=1